MGEKFSVEDLQMIDAGLEALMDQFANAIAKMFGVSRRNVSMICAGTRWAT